MCGTRHTRQCLVPARKVHSSCQRSNPETRYNPFSVTVNKSAAFTRTWQMLGTPVVGLLLRSFEKENTRVWKTSRWQFQVRQESLRDDSQRSMIFIYADDFYPQIQQNVPWKYSANLILFNVWIIIRLYFYLSFRESGNSIISEIILQSPKQNSKRGIINRITYISCDLKVPVKYTSVTIQTTIRCLYFATIIEINIWIECITA